uniref:Transcriptional regulator n=1 Tax=Parastrongyloides trichosuri TaxID=131310 RepID=A0A0N4ZX30_PARTI
MESMLDIEQLKKLTPEQQRQVIAGVQQQAQLQNAQTLITVSFLLQISWNLVSKILQGRIMSQPASSSGDFSSGPSFS